MGLQKEMSFDFSLKGELMTLIYLIAKAEEKGEGRKSETKEPVLQEICKK